MAIRDLIVRISAQSNDFEKRIAEAQRSLSTLSQKAASISSVAFTGLTLPIAAFGGVALKSAADFEALRNGLRTVTKEAGPLTDQLARLKKVAELPGLGFREAIAGSVNLQAAGFSAQFSERALKAFGNALASVGKGKTELDGVILALSQIQGKGKFAAQELNQLAERLPQIRQSLVAAFGTADTEVIQKLGLSTEQIIEKIITEFEKIPQVTGGLKNSFENLRDNIEVALADAGNAIAPFAQSAINAITPLIALIGQAGQAFQQLPAPIQTLSVSLLGLAAAVGPVSFLIQKFAELRIAVLAANAAIVANPIIATIALGAAGAAIAIGDVTSRLDELQRRADNLGKARTTALETFDQFKARAQAGDAELRNFGQSIGDFGLKVRVVAGQSAQLADAFKVLNISTFGEMKTAAADARAALDQIVAAYKRGEASAFDVANATNAYHGVLQKMGLETVTTTERHRKHAEAVKSLAQVFRDVDDAIAGRTETARLTRALFDLQDAAEAGRQGLIPLLPVGESLDAINRRVAASATDAASVLGQVFDARQIDAAAAALDQFGIAATSALEGLKVELPKTAFENIQDILGEQNKAVQQAAIEAGKIQFPKKEASEFGRQVSTVLTDFSRGVTDVIEGTKSLGQAMVGVAQEASRAILRYFIEQGTKQVLASLGQVIAKLFDLQGVFGSIFGTGAKTAINTSSQVASNSVSASQSAAAIGGGLGGIVTAVSGAISAVFDVLQFTQLRRIEQDIGRIEVTSRGILNQSISIQGTLNTWLPYLGGIQEVLQSGLSVASAATPAGGPQSVTFNIYEANDAKSTLSAITRELRTLGVVRG